MVPMETYGHIKRLVGERGIDCEKRLLHSRFRHRDRAAHTAQLMNDLGPNGPRPASMVVVTTQIAELSLDIDADKLHTELAPVGAVLQRSGAYPSARQGSRRSVPVHVVARSRDLAAAEPEW